MFLALSLASVIASAAKQPSPIRRRQAYTSCALRPKSLGFFASLAMTAWETLAMSDSYPRNLSFSASNGLSAITLARCFSPSTTISSSVPAAARSGRTIAIANDLPTRQP